MFRTRLISGIVLVALAIAAILAGKQVVFAVCAALSFIGLFEYYRVVGLERHPPVSGANGPGPERLLHLRQAGQRPAEGVRAEAYGS